MGNSADRAWQLSQLVEGVSTAFNPSHGSLSCVQAGHCVSKQVGRHDAACQSCPRCVSRSPEARFRVLARAVRVSRPAVLSALLVIAVQRVREVVDALPEEDAALLRALYLQTPPLTLRAYSEKTGIPVMTLHYRKAASAF